MLGGLFSMNGNTLFSGPFGTGIGGDFLGVSNSPQLDPLHLFATNQPGGANYIAAHPGDQPLPSGIPMSTGIDPSTIGLLSSAYGNYMNALMGNMSRPGGGGQPSPSPSPGAGMNPNMLAKIAALQAGGGLNGFSPRQFGPNPMSGFRPQPQ